MKLSMIRISAVFAAVALVGSMAQTAEARDEASGTTCIPDPSGPNVTFCTIGQGGSDTATFLGAFASDNGGKGGWVEFYSDDEGEWWVEHHSDGGTSVGWEEGSGANYLTGPKLSFGAPEGAYKKKPALKGVAKKGAKRSYASAKAAASIKTGSVSTFSAPPRTVLTPNPSVQLTFAGTGQCKANVVVFKNGKWISSSGIVAMNFPSTKAQALPSEVGEYTISLQGRDGCVGLQRSVKVSVVPMNLGGIVSK